MSNRSYLTLLFLLTLACKTIAQDAAVKIKVYDDAGLSPGTEQRFIAHLESILAEGGVSARVCLCKRTVSAACETDADGSRRLLIRVVAGQPKTISNAQRPPLGQAVVGPNGGDYASVFVAAVQDRADDTNVPWVTVLAYAAAHEIGHLLLGSEAHAPRGLMKGTWDRKDFESMGQNSFHFSREEVRELASRSRVPEASSRVLEVCP